MEKDAKIVDLTWQIYGLPTPEKEFRFHDIRKWRFDYAWPEQMVAVEIEGGVWSRGRHTRPMGFLGDMEKYNTAVRMGWQIYRFTPPQLKTGEAQGFMMKVFDAHKG